MQLAKASAICAAPIPLRILLAVTFVWAGLGKVFNETTVTGENAALLANMGYKFDTPPTIRPTTQPTAQPTNQPPANSTPEPTETPAGEPTDTPTNPSPQPTPSEPKPADQANIPILPPQITPLVALAPTSTKPPATTPAQAPKAAKPTFTAADFPDEYPVKSLYNLAILTYSAAHPVQAQDGSTTPSIWPEWAARDHWPMTMAWVATITEIAAGILVGVGLLTRLSAVALASMMLSAAWLTEFGPAIQSGDTLLRFLPNHGIWDIPAWRPLMWQFALFGAATALALAGPGSFALDRVPGADDNDDDDLDDD